MAECVCKLSEDGQSQKKESVAYGTYEEDLYEELLANTTGKCQKISEVCKLADPKEPGCTCLRYVKALTRLETFPALTRLMSQHHLGQH